MQKELYFQIDGIWFRFSILFITIQELIHAKREPSFKIPRNCAQKCQGSVWGSHFTIELGFEALCCSGSWFFPEGFDDDYYSLTSDCGGEKGKYERIPCKMNSKTIEGGVFYWWQRRIKAFCVEPLKNLYGKWRKWEKWCPLGTTSWKRGSAHER